MVASMEDPVIWLIKHSTLSKEAIIPGRYGRLSTISLEDNLYSDNFILKNSTYISLDLNYSFMFSQSCVNMEELASNLRVSVSLQRNLHEGEWHRAGRLG